MIELNPPIPEPEPELMCLILFAHKQHERYDLVLLANRDEFYERPALQAEFWDDKPHILAGRDQEEGGTWLGVTSAGRLAAVTNVREPGAIVENARSRGKLVVDFLESKLSSIDFIHRFEASSERYNGFNLIIYDGQDVGYLSNRSDQNDRLLGSGVHGLSNKALNDSWPKVVSGKKELRHLLSRDTIDPSDGFEILADEAQAPDHQLPDTGVGLEKERLLSSRMIRGSNYGTRCSTVILIESTGVIRFVESTVYPPDLDPGTVEFELVPT